MNILVVQETDWIDRNPIQHHHLLEILSSRGHNVAVVDYDLFWPERSEEGLIQPRREFPSIQKIYPRAQIHLIRPGMIRLPAVSRLSWFLANRRELQRLFIHSRPDIVIAYGISNAYLALRLARRYGIHFIFHVLDALHTLAEPPLIRPLARMVERRLFRTADHVVVANRKLIEYAEHMGAAQEKITYIPAGANLAHFRTDLDPELARTAYGLGPSDPVLLFMGWLYPFCGLREIVAALPEAIRRCPTVRLLVAGQGPLLPELQRLRQERGLQQHLHLLGQKTYEELPELLAASDVCLLPFQENASTRYVVPMKLYDYLAAGRPVVANRLPGIAAEFTADDGVILAPGPEQVLEMAVALAQDHARAGALGAAARRRIEANGDWEAVAERFESLLLSHVQREPLRV